ncbi:hypothetical protein K458DRAFT_299649 [Lentithecium fluviatile CBS 122367]|uniref:HRDC domain-containing protein n=1 Tax=Lentithecium fluviatile CBS 122367 TaxID=1168545 RepID=A0A6G1J6R2_9PLEO|nr:hypothetical protein K458DRAFT_299649 [Lentithecium fluviatile CBS 122367]
MDSFKTLQDSISAALKSTTLSATNLSGADIAFQRSLNPSAGTALDSQNARLLQLAQRLLENAAASSDAVGPKLPDAEAIDGNWRGVVDVIDSLLEKADTSLDEYTGVVKRISPGADQAAAAVKPRTNIAVQPKHIPKPQLIFEHPPDNYQTGGFRPLLTTKPHAMVPLEQCLKTFRDKRDREQYPHPYQTEIEAYEYPSEMYDQEEPEKYKPFETTSATFVDTPEALAEMLAELKKADHIAIDVEHHDNRSYIGLVSLMQISTRDKDWIVDTLKPWRRRLECLNEVFADPSKIKVLHGAYMDIVWLQRDLGLYIVGLFDTFHAARALSYPGASLAYLLDKFVGFKAQKQHQLADWRVRPLTQELLEYARADTHFLLYIFDEMRNALVAVEKVGEVLSKSKETALQRYEHPIYDAEYGLGRPGWFNLVSRTPVQFTPQQFAVFRAVHKWRDDVAREEDDSPLFIMPNHAVFSIGRYMPEDKAALFNAVQHVSHILRARADELVRIIFEAKESGVNGPDLYVTLQRVANLKEAEYARSEATPVKAPVPTPVVATQQPVVAVEFDTKALRATTSSFWGDLGPTEQRRAMSSVDVNLALPLPPLTAEIFADANGIADSPSPVHEKPTFIPKEDRPEEDERTDIFVVKQLGGRKRKRTDAAEEPVESTPRLDVMQGDEIMLEDEDPETVKRREKAERKAARKAKKEADRAAVAGSLNYDEDEPAFDYANAPSVLHAQDKERQERKGKDRKGRKEKKSPGGFNPFQKTGDAPKGLGRAPAAQKERAGKSRTFSS